MYTTYLIAVSDPENQNKTTYPAICRQKIIQANVTARWSGASWKKTLKTVSKATEKRKHNTTYRACASTSTCHFHRK